ncbi:hypothetical protein NMY22_g12283 [Coprinellus aureogranulatus]|nr:hypothetical protein NMY22_g12283 [Coprinellus aureogranulatus]
MLPPDNSRPNHERIIAHRRLLRPSTLRSSYSIPLSPQPDTLSAQRNPEEARPTGYRELLHGRHLSDLSRTGNTASVLQGHVELLLKGAQIMKNTVAKWKELPCGGSGDVIGEENDFSGGEHPAIDKLARDVNTKYPFGCGVDEIRQTSIRPASSGTNPHRARTTSKASSIHTFAKRLILNNKESPNVTRRFRLLRQWAYDHIDRRQESVHATDGKKSTQLERRNRESEFCAEKYDAAMEPQVMTDDEDPKGTHLNGTANRQAPITPTWRSEEGTSLSVTMAGYLMLTLIYR